jgi:hypothetical protein
VVILPDAPRIINIGTHVSLCFGTALSRERAPALAVAIERARSHYPAISGERDHIPGARRGAVMIQFTVARRSICYHFFV